MKKISKASIAVAATAAIAAVAVPVAVNAWGDNSETGQRPVYTIEDINAGKLGDKITFNSITNSVFGDERNFVAARLNDGTANGKNNMWNADNITVENGKEYYVRLYAHNNNPNGEKAVAQNTTVSFGIPGTSGTSLKVTGYINSSNATPTEYWDSVVFNSNHKFHLEYVAGSAHLENNGIGAGGTGGAQLSDAIISSGVKIGYQSLDGNVPGCYTYANYIGIKVKAVYDYDYTVEKYVRRAGDKKWEQSVDAVEGDEVEYMILYTNKGNDQQNGVVVKDVLPNNMEYIKGTTYLYNANHPNGIKNNDDTIATAGINIGNYTAGSNAYVIFRAKVINKSLACGTTKVVNWGQVGIGATTLQDSASVFVSRTCKDEPTPTTPVEDDPVTPAPTMPTTGPESVIATALGLGGITTAGAALIASRKKLVK